MTEITVARIEEVARASRASGATILTRVVRANWPLVDSACTMFTLPRVGALFRDAGYEVTDGSFRHLIAKLRRATPPQQANEVREFVSHDTNREVSNTSITQIDQPVVEQMREAPVEPGAIIGGVSSAELLTAAQDAAAAFRRKRNTFILFKEK
jgi:hypothetical protein